VPASAVQRGAPGTYVYLVNPDNTVSVRPIQIGPSEGERIAVQSGLNGGEQVVIDGADRLKDGAKVTVAAAPPSGGGTQPTAATPAGATPAAQPATAPAPLEPPRGQRRRRGNE